MELLATIRNERIGFFSVPHRPNEQLQQKLAKPQQVTEDTLLNLMNILAASFAMTYDR